MLRRACGLLDLAVRRLVLACFVVSAAAMFFMMGLGSTDIFTSFVLRHPVPAAVEAQEVLLAISIFLAIAHTQSRNGHIEVDIVLVQLPERWRRRLRFLPLALGTITCAILGERSWALALDSWHMREAANAIITFPIYPGKFLISAGAWVAALEFARQLAWLYAGAPESRAPIAPSAAQG